MPAFRLLIFTQGAYGQRIFENIRRHAPRNWTVEQLHLPETLPDIVEEPEDIVKGLDVSGDWDLVVFLGESASAFSLLATILKHVSTKAVIAPVDDYSWLPRGLERQIRVELEALNIRFVSPRTFCTLTPSGNPAVDEFALRFGSPRLEVKVKEGVVDEVEVMRGAPCGSTRYMAEKLKGTKVEDAANRAALLVQTYPCLASRQIERLLLDAPIHIAGRMAQKAVEDALKDRK